MTLIHKFTLMCLLIGQLVGQPALSCEMMQAEVAGSAGQDMHAMMGHENSQKNHQSDGSTSPPQTDQACCDDCQCLMNPCQTTWLLSQYTSFGLPQAHHIRIFAHQLLHDSTPPENLLRPPIG